MTHLQNPPAVQQFPTGSRRISLSPTPASLPLILTLERVPLYKRLIYACFECGTGGLRAIMNASIWLAPAAVALTLLLLNLRRARQPVTRTIPSPRDTLLPNLSLEQAAALPYPPDLLPGARDVTTPYGTMRVYEWGPEDGEKVLFIHGDATSAPILSPIARNLVKKGCRIMMFGM